jgi:hypothetical protein
MGQNFRISLNLFEQKKIKENVLSDRQGEISVEERRQVNDRNLHIRFPSSPVMA